MVASVTVTRQLGDAACVTVGARDSPISNLTAGCPRAFTSYHTRRTWRPLAARVVALGALVFGLVLLLSAQAPLSALAFSPDQVARGGGGLEQRLREVPRGGSDNPDAPKLLEPPPITSFRTAAGMFQYVQESMPYDEPMTLVGAVLGCRLLRPGSEGCVAGRGAVGA